MRKKNLPFFRNDVPGGGNRRGASFPRTTIYPTRGPAREEAARGWYGNAQDARFRAMRAQDPFGCGSPSEYTGVHERVYILLNSDHGPPLEEKPAVRPVGRIDVVWFRATRRLAVSLTVWPVLLARKLRS